MTQEPEYQREWSERCRRFAASLAGVPGVDTVVLGRETTGRVPLVEIVLSTPAKAATISRELREGMPSIHVNERRVGEGRLTFNPVGLDGGQEDVVADALRRLLGAGPAR